MKLLNVLITAFCCLIFAYDWYIGTLVPAWMALIWCLATFFGELTLWLESR